MDKTAKIEAFYAQEGPYQEGVNILRELALKTRLKETLKWGMPVYTLANKNVFGITSFKTHFGIWFYNGVFLSDPKEVLGSGGENTKAMRHWKFESAEEIDRNAVLAYMEEAIANQEIGVELVPERNKETVIPDLLQDALQLDAELRRHFEDLTPFKQREYCEHIASAKQEKTKHSRLQKSIPLILQGKGLHDKYRK